MDFLNPLSPGQQKAKILAPALMICLAFPSFPQGDSETKQPPIAPGVQRERVNLILIDVVVTDRRGNRVEDLRLSPELFHDFPISLEARSYLEKGDKAYLEIAIAVPDTSLLFLPREGKYTARLEAGVILRRGRSQVVDQFSREVEAKLTEKDFSERGYLTLVSRREVPPGEFEAVAVVRDLGTGNIGALRSTIKVPAFSSDRIAVSSLVLESPQVKTRRVDIDPATESDPSLVIPVVQRAFGRGAQVSGSCVVYHPQREPTTGEARVRVKGSIRRGDETVQSIADSLHTFQDATQAAAIPLEFPLPLSGLNPGIYSLEIQALDEVGNRGVTQRVDFLVR